ncbi:MULTISPECIES: hypothetical protein [unclassified Nostoc]|nr:hypothetical protein [Nostoc sp. DedQUE03]MDZ7974695.1 hypothetical protein [Nostoc sp. DedQUE03]MDZ8049299.1 hypothetical protein [Nostoc sp. DedQUE02]
MPLSLKLLSKALPAIGIGLLAADDVGFDKIYKKGDRTLIDAIAF